MVHFGEFLKTWSLGSNSVTRQFSFNRTKIGGKCQKSNATFWVIFKQCEWREKLFWKASFPPHIFCQFFKRYFSYPKLFSFDLGIEVHKCIHSNFLTRNEMIYNAFFPQLQDYLFLWIVQRFDPTFMASDIGKRALESLTDKMYFKSWLRHSVTVNDAHLSAV